MYSKTCVKRPISKRPKIGFQDQLSLNAGQKYCRMLQGEHSAILLTFIKLPFVIKIFVLSIFEWPFYTYFTVRSLNLLMQYSSLAVSSSGMNTYRTCSKVSNIYLKNKKNKKNCSGDNKKKALKMIFLTFIS